MAVADERRNGAAKSYGRLLAERLGKVKALAINRGPNSRIHRDLDGKRQLATDEFLATQDELGNRAPNIKVESAVLFWITSSGIFLLEASVNRVVVEMATPLPVWMAFLVAAAASAVLVFFAHAAGALFRQMWSEIEQKLNIGNILLGLFLIAIDGVIVVAISALRGYFVTLDVDEAINVFDVAETIASLGLDALWGAMTDPEALTLGGVNLLFLFLAYLLGMLSHDSEAEFDARYKSMRKLERKLARQVARYEKRQEQVFARYVRPIERTTRIYVANGGSIEELPVDDFKAHRLEAERPDPQSPSEKSAPPLRSVPAAKRGETA